MAFDNFYRPATKKAKKKPPMKGKRVLLPMAPARGQSERKYLVGKRGQPSNKKFGSLTLSPKARRQAERY